MTTPQTRRRRRRPSAPTVPARAAASPAPVRPRSTAGCCRTWSSEHRISGGAIVRTTWHEPACRAWPVR
ncbi:hypothetical protein ACFVFS_23565 [Kitasatospora sp. NPDC057692]|uniref:hypothetical protein n=1 Tax=Kitasatospora sp. NPDC057692 TaxID=3346215 RepID=UPI0036AAED27